MSSDNVGALRSGEPHGNSRLLTIGEFARRAQLSVKALRLYERLGVLVPDHVDVHSGYRRYHERQLAVARLVAMLRRLDMPLAEVGRVLAADGPAGADLVRQYWDAVERRVAAQRELAEHLRARLSGGTDRPPMFDAVRVRDVPAQWVLSERRHVPVEQLSGWLGRTMPRLAGAAGRCGPLFVVYHGEVNQDSDGPVEVCAPVGQMPGVRLIPAYREAFVRIRKAQVAYPQILSAFDAVAQWPAEHGMAVAGAPREVYFGDFDAAASIDEVCDVGYPVTPAGTPVASPTASCPAPRPDR
jgi:DNA-binding transcriptional MerR regulator